METLKSKMKHPIKVRKESPDNYLGEMQTLYKLDRKRKNNSVHIATVEERVKRIDYLQEIKQKFLPAKGSEIGSKLNN